MMNIKLVLLITLLSLASFTSNAGTKVLKNDVQLVFMGVDPITQGLIFEGTSIGEYGTGTVKALGFLFNQIDTQLYLSAQWTFSDVSGASMTGANSGRLDAVSLDFIERGTVLTCFGELSHFCGCTFLREGMVSDVAFIPYVTTLSAQASIYSAKNGDCLARSNKKDKDKYKDEDGDDD